MGMLPIAFMTQFVFQKTVIFLPASCGGVAQENGTYFVNPNHPDTTGAYSEMKILFGGVRKVRR